MLNKKLVLGFLGFAAVVAFPMAASAAVTGICSNCHTMHATDGAGADNAAGPQNTLLLATGCIGCHATLNVENGSDGRGLDTVKAPQVDNTLAPLAGSYINNAGYFMVNTTDQTNAGKQHNVFGIALMDQTLVTASSVSPGGNWPTQGAAGFPDLTCGDCHNASGGHHSTATGNYRLLSGNATTSTQPDFGAAVAPANVGTRAEVTYDATTMNNTCAACHAAFHGDTTSTNYAGSGTWLRHPTGITVVGAGPSIPAAVTANDSVVMGGGQIMCLSCHVAHGGPYDNLLSFDYSLNVAGGGVGVGCETCHSYSGGGM